MQTEHCHVDVAWAKGDAARSEVGDCDLLDFGLCLPLTGDDKPESNVSLKIKTKQLEKQSLPLLQITADRTIKVPAVNILRGSIGI